MTRRVAALPAALLLGVALAAPGAAPLAATLEAVRASGAVRCGVSPELPGFSTADSLGRFEGFDIELCRVIAAAVLGDADAVEPVPLEPAARFLALGAREVDLLALSLDWTLVRDARYGEFAGAVFHDGQAFMARRERGLRSALELDDRRVCVERGTNAELVVADFFTTSGLRYRPLYFDGSTALFDGYERGECEAVTAGRLALAARRSGFERAAAHVILPELISKETRGPMVRADDERWENIVRWSLACMIDAEELGVRSTDVPTLVEREAVREAAGAGAEAETTSGVTTTNAVSRLLGLAGGSGAELGLEPTWCADIVRLVGNYDEVYTRHLGPDSALGLERSINALWSAGGLIYAPPVR